MTKRFRARVLLAPATGLLAVLLFAAPALAWDVGVSASAACNPDSGKVDVSYTLQTSDDTPTQPAGTFTAWYVVTTSAQAGAPVALPGGTLDEHGSASGSFSLDAAPSESVVVYTSTSWEGHEQEVKSHSEIVELPASCETSSTEGTSSSSTEESTTTSSTEESTTTSSTEESTTTSSTEESTTTTVAAPATTVAGATSSSTSGGLPFTGANTLPLLLVGGSLLGIGGAVLLASRRRASSIK